MNSLQSGIGPEEKLTYETQGVNFENIPQAKSENLGKTLYILTAKKKTDLAVFEVFFLEQLPEEAPQLYYLYDFRYPSTARNF